MPKIFFLLCQNAENKHLQKNQYYLPSASPPKSDAPGLSSAMTGSPSKKGGRKGAEAPSHSQILSSPSPGTPIRGSCPRLLPETPIRDSHPRLLPEAI